MKVFLMLCAACGLMVSCERHEFDGPDGTKQLHEEHGHGGHAAGGHGEHAVESHGDAGHEKKDEHKEAH